MDMLSYISEIQRRFVTQYGYPENPEKPGLPMWVPDGDYPMEIEGKTDHVRIKNGLINCCRFQTLTPTPSTGAEDHG